MEQKYPRNKSRPWIQLAAAVFMNGYAAGFVKGSIFQGKSKLLCVPGLNCYSCPGALGSCPIGALQAVLSSRQYHFSYYVFGTLILFGVLAGRLICGFLCPFGFFQDLLYKLKAPKLTIPTRVDKPLRLLKIGVLLIFVIMLPALVRDAYGMGAPTFCKWLCPAGTLEGGLPLIFRNESLRASLGLLFGWKAAILAAVVIFSVFIYRPFCKYLCPLGAFYSFFNKIGFVRMQVDEHKCTHCLACERTCRMGVEVTRNINAGECIRCGDCRAACPQGAISMGFWAGERPRAAERGDQ